MSLPKKTLLRLFIFISHNVLSGPIDVAFVCRMSFYNVSDYMDTIFFLLLSLMFPRKKPHIDSNRTLSHKTECEKCAVKCFFNGNNQEREKKKDKGKNYL